MAKPEIVWTKNANLLMQRRDHYAQDAIRGEFTADKGSAVPVDEQHRWFVTPVVDYRYSVVWRQDPDQQKVFVEAVLPAYFSGKRAGQLMKQVKEAVERESGGVVILPAA